jgi:hypothetical protein
MLALARLCKQVDGFARLSTLCRQRTEHRVSEASSSIQLSQPQVDCGGQYWTRRIRACGKGRGRGGDEERDEEGMVVVGMVCVCVCVCVCVREGGVAPIVNEHSELDIAPSVCQLKHDLGGDPRAKRVPADSHRPQRRLGLNERDNPRCQLFNRPERSCGSQQLNAKHGRAR